MRKPSWLMALVAAMAFHAPTRAELLTPDAVPAATLLLPYFEVDLDGNSSSAITTLFAINNASAAPALAHVVLWTDLGVPTFTFDVYLTGYDVQRLSLRDVFVDGLLPLLPFALSDGGAGNTCEELNTGQLTEEQLTHIQAAHTGQAPQTFGNQCSAFPTATRSPVVTLRSTTCWSVAVPFPVMRDTSTPAARVLRVTSTSYGATTPSSILGKTSPTASRSSISRQ